MADTLVERVTGQACAPAVPVEVDVVMTDQALLGDDAEPAFLEGYGPIPAPLAREDLMDLPEDVSAWLRRLYVEPDTRALVAMESRRRLFEGRLRRLVVLRDLRCRTPWCDAPIRHVDHARSAARGGRTTASNAQGLCEACNLVKETEAWQTATRPDGSVVTRTPTGHSYLSRPPPQPGTVTGASSRRPAESPTLTRAEIFFRDIVLCA